MAGVYHGRLHGRRKNIQQPDYDRVDEKLAPLVAVDHN
jgi:hypothetical protein